MKKKLNEEVPKEEEPVLEISKEEEPRVLEYLEENQVKKNLKSQLKKKLSQRLKKLNLLKLK